MEIVGGEATHLVDINPRVNQQGLLDQMEDRISKSHPSTLPHETRTNKKRCIFRLPKKLKNINGKSFEPQVVALGPYHHDKPQLQNMEEFKWRCLAYFMESRKGKLEECLKELGQLEKEVRECYSESETINLISRDVLLQMMVVDGCFILMLFFRVFSNVTELGPEERPTSNNPLYKLDMVILPKIYGDLLLLENQIPSCVLKTLYRICFNISYNKHSLFVIAMKFLCSISVIPKFRNMPNSLEWLHLLDLVRSIFISCLHDKEMRETHNSPFSPIPCLTKLRRAGIKVNRHMADNFLDVKFKNGMIEMPDIILNASNCLLLVNCVVFEQSCNISKHFSIYTTLLDCLVNTARDVDYLCDHHIIDNFIGTDAEAAQFINILGKDLIIYKDCDADISLDNSSKYRGDNDDTFLLDIFGDVNEYYQKRLSWGNWQWMSFKREYFGKPWLLISAFVGFVLLSLTFLQTYYTIYAYEHPKN